MADEGERLDGHRHFRYIDREWKQIVWEILNRVQDDIHTLEGLVRGDAVTISEVNALKERMEKVEATGHRNELNVKGLMAAAQVRGAIAGFAASLIVMLLGLLVRWLLQQGVG